MSNKFPDKALFLKRVFVLAMLSFAFSSIGYAYTDSLRPSAARNSSVTEEIQFHLESAGTDAWRINSITPRIQVLSNIISLLEGAQTGGYNIEHAILDGADGGIFNHSERRGRMEVMMRNMLRGYISSKSSLLPIEIKIKPWSDTLKVEGLTDEEIEPTYAWLDNFLADNSQTETFELLSRKLVNYIVNLQLKEVIAYSDRFSITQTVLCVGETKEQYGAGKTKAVLEQDLFEMLDGVSIEQAKKIGLRLAYEPRWAIGAGKTPQNDEIQNTHRFIKDICERIFLGEKDLDSDYFQDPELVSAARLDVDYGGSLNEKNCTEILALPDVDGGLIGGAAKTAEKIAVIIKAAIEQGAIKGKVLNIGMNWKAEDKTTNLSSLKSFVELFQTIDLNAVRIVISTPQARTVKTAMSRLVPKISLNNADNMESYIVSPDEIAQKLNVDLTEYNDYMFRDHNSYAILGGDHFSHFVFTISSILKVDNTPDNTYALIVAPNFFKSPAARTALREFAYLSKTVRIVLYGENAEKLKALIAADDTITADSFDGALRALSDLGIKKENTLLLRTVQDELTGELDIKQVVARGGVSTLAVAKASKELLRGVKANPNAIDEAFRLFFEMIALHEIIPQQAYNDNREDMMAKLEEGKAFEFPVELGPAPRVTEQLEEESRKISEFLTQIGV